MNKCLNCGQEIKKGEGHMNTKPVVFLKNWSIVVDNFNPFMAPELEDTNIRGQVYNHPRHSDGKFVRLSKPIIGYNEAENKIETNNTIYVLENADPDYENMFKNAKERFWKTIKEQMEEQ